MISKLLFTLKGKCLAEGLGALFSIASDHVNLPEANTACRLLINQYGQIVYVGEGNDYDFGSFEILSGLNTLVFEKDGLNVFVDVNGQQASGDTISAGPFITNPTIAIGYAGRYPTDPEQFSGKIYSFQYYSDHSTPHLGTGGTGGNNGGTGGTGGETEPVFDPDAAGLYPIDVTGSAGAEIKVPFLVNNFQGISGIQTTITWDESVMELVMDGDNPKVTDSPEIMTGFPFILPNYFSMFSSNELTMVWDESFDPENGRSLDDESVLFALHFTLIGNAGDTGVIRLSDDPTPFKLAPGSGEDIDETTQWAEISLINEFTVSGNVTMMGDESNLPVSGVTVTLNQDGSDNDTLTDASGDYSFTLTSGSGIELSANLPMGRARPVEEWMWLISWRCASTSWPESDLRMPARWWQRIPTETRRWMWPTSWRCAR